MFSLLFTVLGVLWRGYVLSFLWGWFMVPLGVRPIGVAASIGLSVLVGMLAKEGLKGSDLAHKVSDTDSWILWAGNSFLWPLFSLGMGWICHLLMG